MTYGRRAPSGGMRQILGGGGARVPFELPSLLYVRDSKDMDDLLNDREYKNKIKIDKIRLKYYLEKVHTKYYIREVKTISITRKTGDTNVIIAKTLLLWRTKEDDEEKRTLHLTLCSYTVQWMELKHFTSKS